MKQLFNEPDVRIAALCDINEESDYSMFYHRGTAGLKPGYREGRTLPLPA